METISSGLQAARTMFSSARQAASREASYTAWSAGRQISWMTSLFKSSLASLRSRSVNPSFSSLPSASNQNIDGNSSISSITTPVAVEPLPPSASHRTVVCYETVARTLAEHIPRSMSPEGKENLNEAITCLSLSTKPGVSKARKEFYRNRAVAYTQAAISKYPPDVQADIRETLTKLESQYDALQQQINSLLEVETGVNEDGEIVDREVPLEIDPQEILRNMKVELSKTAKAALAPQKTSTPAVSQQSL